MGSVTEVYFNDDKALAHLSPKIVQINTVAAADRKDVTCEREGVVIT